MPDRFKVSKSEHSNNIHKYDESPDDVSVTEKLLPNNSTIETNGGMLLVIYLIQLCPHV